MNNFWNGKKVLITGINGFIGGNLAKKLNSFGDYLSIGIFGYLYILI